MKKVILCATDFSDNAYTALQYAANLAQDIDADLTLYYAYSVDDTLLGSQDVFPERPDGIDYAPQATEKIRKLCDEQQRLRPDLSINYSVEEAEVISGIQKFTIEHPVIMVVMGTQGNNKLKEVFFGGTTLEAMRELNCPVLAVPMGAIYRKPQQIVYASDLQPGDLEVTKQVIGLTEKLRPSIYLAHFFYEENMTFQQDADDFKRAVKDEITYTRLKLTSQTYGKLTDYIDKEIHQRKADILVMREREHGLIHDLFHKDVVEEFIHHTELPLLVFNDSCLVTA